MADPFTNARPYFDVTFPSSGDGFSISKMRNSLSGLGFMDFIPLQPRAHNPQDTKIMVRGRDASGYFNPIYAGDSNTRLAFASGDSPAMAAPVSNPRIDIVYLTASGDIRIVTGTEAVSPTLPTLAPSGDSRLPIAAIWLKPSMSKVVNFEDKDSNSGDGYIYQDLRPFLRSPGAGAATLTSVTTPVSPTGDAQAAIGVLTTAARADHKHGGVRNVHISGSGDMQGDVQFNGPVTQQGSRITIANLPMSLFKNLSVSCNSNTLVVATFDDLVFQAITNNRAAWARKRSVTIDITLSGAGGKSSVAALAANTLYYVWLIYDAVADAFSGVLDTSAISPTIPGPYTHYALVSVAGTDNSSNLIKYNQNGRRYNFKVWGTLVSNNTTTNAWAVISLLPANMTTNPGFVPSALSNFCYGSFSGATGVIAITNDNSVATSTTEAPNKLAFPNIANVDNFWQFDVITADTLYWLANDVNALIRLHGFELNKLT